MRRFMLVGIMALCLAAGTASAADVKIGYVDMQRALNSSEAGKEAKEQLAARLKKYQDEINAKQDELKKLKDELEKQGMLLSETARANKEKDYQQKLKEFQRFTKDAQDELQGKDEEFTRKIIEELEKVIKEFASTNGYTFVFAKNDSLLLYVDTKADVTDDVLKILNAVKKK